MCPRILIHLTGSTFMRRSSNTRHSVTMNVASTSRKRFVYLVAALVAIPLLASCATLGRAAFREPVVSLQDVAITGLGLTGGNVDVVLSVYNPNGFSLNALSMTYIVDVESIQLGSGQLGQSFVVQQGDTSIVRLPLSFTYLGIGTAGRQLLQSGAVNYRVRGDFTVSTPIGNFTRPYSQTGRYSTVVGGSRR